MRSEGQYRKHIILIQSDFGCSSIGKMRHIRINVFSVLDLAEILLFVNNNYNNTNTRSTKALKSSGTRVQKRINNESLIVSMSRGQHLFKA